MKTSIPLLGLLLASSTTAWAATENTKIERLAQLEKQVSDLKKEVDTNTQTTTDLTPKIKIGGAVRFQYSYEDYNEENKERGGDMDFDVFRLDVNGSIGDVKVSAQYRWYQYMNVVHHAYVGYDFNEHWEGKAGITQVPFGNLAYNSNNFFFSSAFYAGLEDDYDTGLSFIGKYDKHDIRLAYFKNDELGGIDGYVDNKTDRYSYDVVGLRGASEDIYDTPATAMAESNTINLRYAYTFDTTEVGASLLSGDLVGTTGSLGDNNAYAVHVKSNVGNFGIMAQYTSYEYDLNDNSDSVAVGAYSFHDTIPAEATLYNLNISYSQDLTFGPITNITYYNDYNLMTDKSGSYQEDTMMNVTGMAISAGGIYAYVDYIIAKNQPFVGGTFAGDSDETNQRLNINIGYYF
jgi:hypothetical protein